MEADSIYIQGKGGILGEASGMRLYVGNSGTSSWFLISALMLLKEGVEVEMYGDAWIEERPMDDLIVPLIKADLLQFKFLKEENSIPFVASSKGFKKDILELTIKCDVSS